MKIPRSIMGAATAIIVLTGASTAQATFFNSEAAFNAANPGLTLINFEGIASAGSISAIAPNTFAGVNLGFSIPKVASATFANFNFPGTSPSDFFFNDLFGGSGTMTFNPAINAVGFLIALGTNGSSDTGGNATLKIFDGVTLLDTQIVAASGLGAFDTFVGWSGLGSLDNVSVAISSGSNWVSLDNLRFGSTVPEPATLAIFGIGLAGLGFMRRRRAA